MPEVLSFREFRAGLAAALDRVKRSDEAAVFVGAHCKPEDLMLFVAVAAGELSTAELRNRIVGRYRR